MARKGNEPDKDTEETGSRRRYQSPQTPPQAPRSAGTQQGRGQARPQDEQDEEEVSGRFDGRGSDFDLEKASRDELNAIAQELEIEDYDSMNREELVMEIRERS